MSKRRHSVLDDPSIHSFIHSSNHPIIQSSIDPSNPCRRRTQPRQLTNERKDTRSTPSTLGTDGDLFSIRREGGGGPLAALCGTDEAPNTGDERETLKSKEERKIMARTGQGHVFVVPVVDGFCLGDGRKMVVVAWAAT